MSVTLRLIFRVAQPSGQNVGQNARVTKLLSDDPPAQSVYADGLGFMHLATLSIPNLLVRLIELQEFMDPSATLWPIAIH